MLSKHLRMSNFNFHDKLLSLKAKIRNLRNRHKNFLSTSLDKENPHQKKQHPKINDKSKVISEKMELHINPFSIAKATAMVLVMVLLLVFAYDIRNILVIFFISFLLAAAFDPLIDYMSRWKVPRTLGILIVYVVVLMGLGIFITNVVSLVAEQVTAIAKNVQHFVINFDRASILEWPFGPQIKPYVDQFLETVDIETAALQLQSAFQLISTQLVSISLGLMNVLIVLILTFFMTVEEKTMERFFLSLFPSRYGQYISGRLTAIKDQIGLWLRGQLLVSIVAALISYVGLVIMGVNYALTLSFIAGLAMVIPVVGRLFAWFVTFPIVFNQAPLLSLWMSIYYLVVQQFENNLIVPYIMNRAVGLSPIIIIFAMMVGNQYLGILGLILAVPVATTVALFVKDYVEREK